MSSGRLPILSSLDRDQQASAPTGHRQVGVPTASASPARFADACRISIYRCQLYDRLRKDPDQGFSADGHRDVGLENQLAHDTLQ